MRLGVTTLCPHVYWEGQWWSYQPFVLEMNLWTDLFDRLVMIAPLEKGTPPNFWQPYRHSDRISVIPISENKGKGLFQKRSTVLDIFPMLSALLKSLSQCDAYHLRSPANISLVASIFLPPFTDKISAKYAGAWANVPDEPLSYILQKMLLRSKWFCGPVTVYGNWANQPSHVKPFFTSVMDTATIERAKLISSTKYKHDPLRVIFVGRLTRAKNVHVLLSSLAKVIETGFDIQARIIGDGPEMNALLQQSVDLRLDNKVVFMGGMEFEQVLSQYEWADVLVLASETEGWPKSVTEAMAFGNLVVASNRGLIPQILENGRGILVEPDNVGALSISLQRIASGEVNFEEMSSKASQWSQGYSLDGLKRAVRELLVKEWHLNKSDLRSD